MDLTGLDRHQVKLELLPHLLDRLAKEVPEKTWTVLPKVSSDWSQGFDEISYAVAANAINRIAWFFHKSVGKPWSETFPVVSYIGPADLRYLLMPLALVKCGYQAFLLSDLSSSDMREHLLKAAECKLFACSDSSSNDPVLARLGLEPIVVPELEILLATDLVDPYPYIRTIEQGLNDPLMKVHTSGTSSITGHSKLVTYRLGTTCAAQVQEQVPDLNGYKNSIAKDAELERLYTGFRVSHAGGVWLALRFMYQDLAVVLGGADPLSLGNFECVLNGAGIDAVFGPPILFEAIAKRPDLVRQLSKLKRVICSGGKLTEAAAEEILMHTELCSYYGSTENAAPAGHTVEQEDWQYCHFSPEYSHFSFRRHPPDDPSSNLFEAVMVRHPDPAVRRAQPVFWNFPDRTEWSMEDLFEPHPTKPNHWRYVGRCDEMIITGSGTNILPTFFEREILQFDPRVKKAVIYGNGEAHLAVLVELTTPVDGAANIERLKQELWPLVDKCNQKMSNATQVAKHAIVIAAKDRPLPRGGKGDVQRRLAETMYEKELAMAFENK